MSKIKFPKGPKWICLTCNFAFNMFNRKRCKICGRRKTGHEKIWEFK